MFAACVSPPCVYSARGIESSGTGVMAGVSGESLVLRTKPCPSRRVAHSQPLTISSPVLSVFLPLFD